MKNINFINTVNAIYGSINTGNFMDKPRVFAISAGLAVAMAHGTFPSSEVIQPGEHYIATQSQVHGESIYILNECVTFNRDLAISVARSFWRYRYAMIYSKSFCYNQEEDFFNAIGSVKTYFQPDDVTFMNANRLAIISTTNDLIKLLTQE